MRKILKNNDEVAHFWANQSQSEGKAYSMLFEGDTVYSYGKHWELGKLVTDKNGKTVALLNAETCSPSTGKHAYKVRRAVSHLPTFLVKPENRGHAFGSRTASINTNHLENVKVFISSIDTLKDGLKRGRTGLEWKIRSIKESASELLEYADRFKVPISKLTKEEKKKFLLFKGNKAFPFTHGDLELINKYKAREALGKEREQQVKNGSGPLFEAYQKGIEAREKQKANKLHEEALKIDAQREAWLKGEPVYYPSVGYHEPHKLRVKGDRIETTGRAEISLSMAEKFWKRFKIGSDISGFDFGPYQAREERAVENGLLIVGCHRIPVTELQRIAAVLGWE